MGAGDARVSTSVSATAAPPPSDARHAPPPLIRYASNASLTSQPSPAVGSLTGAVIIGTLSAEASPAIGFMNSAEAAAGSGAATGPNGPNAGGSAVFSGGALSAYGGPESGSSWQGPPGTRSAAAGTLGSASAVLHAAASGVPVSPLIQSNPPPKDAVAPLPNGAYHGPAPADAASGPGAAAGASFGAGAGNGGQKKRFLIMDAAEESGMETPSSRRSGSAEGAQAVFPSHSAGPAGPVSHGAAGGVHEPVGNPSNHHWLQTPAAGHAAAAAALVGPAYPHHAAGPGIQAAPLRPQGGADGPDAPSARPALPHGRTMATLVPAPHAVSAAGGSTVTAAAARSAWRSADPLHPLDDAAAREASGAGGAALNPPGQPSAEAQAPARRPQPYAAVRTRRRMAEGS